MRPEKIEMLIDELKFQLITKCQELGPQKFADLVGVKISYASKLKKFNRKFPTDTVLKFAKILRLEQ